MTEFKVGDIVRVSKGEPDKPGHVIQVCEVAPNNAPGMIAPPILCVYEDEGWTVELIERPAPPLPTKPNTIGWATVGDSRHLARLAVGQWELYDADGSLGATPHPSTIADFTEAALIPKELADRVTEWAELDAMDGYRLLGDLADHLKGQDDE